MFRIFFNINIKTDSSQRKRMFNIPLKLVPFGKYPQITTRVFSLRFKHSMFEGRTLREIALRHNKVLLVNHLPRINRYHGNDLSRYGGLIPARVSTVLQLCE